MSSVTLSERIRFVEESIPAGREILALLSRWIETGPDEELFRINPLAWATAHRTDPDLTVDVFLHCAKAGVLGRLAARTLRIPALFTAHGWSFGEGVPGFRRRLYRWLERGAAPLGDRIIVVCDGDRRVAIGERVASARKLRL